MTPEDELIALIHQVQNHDDRAVERLLSQVRDRMKGFYRERAGANDMSDFAQEIIAKVWESLPSFSGDTDAQFWAWVTELARNRWVDALRWKNRAETRAWRNRCSKGRGVDYPYPYPASGPVKSPCDVKRTSKCAPRLSA